MVFFFTCSDPQYVVYMGRDKFENEELLKYGFPEDIWFHVDKLSSAHVYLRLPPGSMDLSGVKDKALAGEEDAAIGIEFSARENRLEMCQLTKANSIDGCKAAECDVVYTPFLNLKKEERMDTGQVGFKDEAFRILVRNVEKDKDIVKALEKTRCEKKVDFVKEKEQRDNEERTRRRKFIEEEKRLKKEEENKHREEKELKTYAVMESLEKAPNLVNKSGTVEECRELEEDFM
eukprot:CAMPEP_0179371028 /NCGR_PEP_ID=MMETSP0797-20121207/85494_1 /TAXON_ID=47934 /ORGANISM="Dinophysis acuminata, Strain DAEP01" /LENGTH=232 /DNA_ID=CAMNT_0021086827 /DNA_START=1 /DNA_END=700 /DNA_ORIENTATION=-